MNKADDPNVAAAIAEGRRQNLEAVERHPVVSQDEWQRQRLALLEKEKHYVRAGDRLAAEVRALPWVKIEKSYTFTSPQGDLTLADLFRQHSQLLVKHFMMEPGQEWQCQGCSLESDHIDGLLPHFEHHDLSYVAVSRAPIEQIEPVRKRMGWKFCWVSSYKSDFNYDFHVSFRPEEVQAGKTFYNFREKKIGPQTYTLSGHSVFYKNFKGEIFRTYGTFGRGGEQFMGVYSYFDVLPKGREEYGPTRSLPDWAQVHDQYEREGNHQQTCECAWH
ncbi:MAG TPA: DUF899 family protein [Terracidiphilus sp.]|jgi:predicted dithiol-disulfide oxidoreductase (DUF899 family)